MYNIKLCWDTITKDVDDGTGAGTTVSESTTVIKGFQAGFTDTSGVQTMEAM
jgi:hypothetical protein